MATRTAALPPAPPGGAPPPPGLLDLPPELLEAVASALLPLPSSAWPTFPPCGSGGGGGGGGGRLHHSRPPHRSVPFVAASADLAAYRLVCRATAAAAAAAVAAVVVDLGRRPGGGVRAAGGGAGGGGEEGEAAAAAALDRLRRVTAAARRVTAATFVVPGGRHAPPVATAAEATGDAAAAAVLPVQRAPAVIPFYTPAAALVAALPLRSLTLVGSRAVALFPPAALPPRLSRLSLVAVCQGAAAPPAVGPLLAALASRLTHLHLDALAVSGAPPPLDEWLSAGGGGAATAPAASAGDGSAGLPALRTLAYTGVLTATGAAALAAAAPRLRVLEYSGALRGTGALAPLAGPAALPRLAVLSLGWVDAPAGGTAWADLTRGRSLDRLALGAGRRGAVGGMGATGLARALAATAAAPRVLDAPGVVMDVAELRTLVARRGTGTMGGVVAESVPAHGEGGAASAWPSPPPAAVAADAATAADAAAAVTSAATAVVDACRTVTLGLAGMATSGGDRVLAAAFPAATTLTVSAHDDVAAGALAIWAPPPAVRVLTVTFCYAPDAAGLLAGLAAAAPGQRAHRGGGGVGGVAATSLVALTIRGAEVVAPPVAAHVTALVAAGLRSLRLVYARGAAATAATAATLDGGEGGGGGTPGGGCERGGAPTAWAKAVLPGVVHSRTGLTWHRR
ncbi:hypothetical protein I4F81_001438 [Pyropia yezoensis]|uniref:Uncharacterized protein n=1 Tax=Pyropia yezoensis TaxID=2788 RepID=A0ACC3BMJ7_PYRYE|nr:hypothetical protein I4F81_001438 [Neopyropia yezoensis]